MPENTIFYDVQYVTPITSSKTESITDTIHDIYNLEFTGIAQATDTLRVSHDNGPWGLFDTKNHEYPFGTNSTTTEYIRV